MIAYESLPPAIPMIASKPKPAYMRCSNYPKCGKYTTFLDINNDAVCPKCDAPGAVILFVPR